MSTCFNLFLFFYNRLLLCLPTIKSLDNRATSLVTSCPCKEYWAGTIGPNSKCHAKYGSDNHVHMDVILGGMHPMSLAKTSKYRVTVTNCGNNGLDRCQNSRRLAHSSSNTFKDKVDEDRHVLQIHLACSCAHAASFANPVNCAKKHNVGCVGCMIRRYRLSAVTAVGGGKVDALLLVSLVALMLFTTYCSVQSAITSSCLKNGKYPKTYPVQLMITSTLPIVEPSKKVHFNPGPTACNPEGHNDTLLSSFCVNKCSHCSFSFKLDTRCERPACRPPVEGKGIPALMNALVTVCASAIIL